MGSGLRLSVHGVWGGVRVQGAQGGSFGFTVSGFLRMFGFGLKGFWRIWCSVFGPDFSGSSGLRA